MDNTKNYLQVLSESLDKKILILDEISKLTEIQKDIVSADSFDDEAFDSNVEKKAGLIYELVKLDNGFQILYDNVKKLTNWSVNKKKTIDKKLLKMNFSEGL